MTLQVVGFFCEDVREEKSGQLTLVGVLPDTINIPRPPPDLPDMMRARMPKLGLYVRVHMSLDYGGRSMKTKLKFPDGGETPIGVVDEAIIAKAKDDAVAQGLPIAGVIQHAVLQGFAIPNPPGLVTAILEVDGTEHMAAILRFIYDEQTISPNVSAPPA
jgi:hypothetical protein